jgi:hypothetical protein
MKLGIYKHAKKGTLYRVLAVGKHSETLEDYVVYEALYENPTSKIWIRPKEMFLEEVEINGRRTPRFIFMQK